MSIPDDLRIGDRVSHPMCGAGTVTLINWDARDWRQRGVHVEYDHVSNSGQHTRGVYDRDWFAHATCKLTRLAEAAHGSDNANDQ